MVKKIIITVFSLLLLVYLVFFGDFFNLNFSDKQLETLVYLFKVYIGASLVAFVVSEIFQNYSQVDKLWSTIPIYYVWYFTAESGYDPRMVLMSIIATIWGLRLSYNFGRRGGYSIYFWVGEEDYRWKELKRIAPFLRPRLNWAVFNLFFICLYQMGLVFLTTLPILAAWQGTNDISTYDYFIALIMLFFIILETLSDQQSKSQGIGIVDEYNIAQIALIPKDRRLLHSRIEERFHQMIIDGFVDEVQLLHFKDDLTKDLPAMRSANTGISALIDPYGRIINKIPLNVEGYIDVSIPKKIDKTLYSKIIL